MTTKGAVQTSNERQLFLLRLSDALRPLADPLAVQVEAARILGEYLHANRVGYAEVQEDNVTMGVTRQYTNAVPAIEGRYRYDTGNLTPLNALKSGRTVALGDIARAPSLTADEKAFCAMRQMGAVANAPLVKAGRLVALLFVHFATAHEWSQSELTLIDETAERTWAAVERARAEAALQKSEANFRQIFELTGIGMAQADPYTLRFLLVNRKLCEMTGYTEAELINLSTIALTHPDDRAQPQLLWAKTLAGETAQFSFEKRYVRKDGRVIWVSIVATILRDSKGTPQRAVATIQDITERKVAEAAQQESEARLTEILDHIPAAVYLKSVDGAILFANRQALAVASGGDAYQGRLEAELLPTVPPEVLAHIREHDLAVLNATTPIIFEESIPHPDGTPHDYLSTKFALHKNGEPYALVGISQEITARKMAEAIVRENAEQKAFLLKLSDALQPLGDPLAIQAAALRVIGEHLQVDRVFYGEVTADSETIIIIDNYVREGVAKIIGRIPVRNYGEATTKLSAGQTRVVGDVNTTFALSEQEKATYKAMGIAASIGVPLVKDGRWVANLGVHQQSARQWRAEEIALVVETAERTWAAVARARAEEQVRTAYTHLTNVFARITDCFYALDNHFRFTDVNPQAEAYFGISKAAMIGRTVTEVLPTAQNHEVWFKHQEALRDQKSMRLKFLSPTTGKWIDLVIYPAEEGLTVYFHDISARKEAEAALQHLNATLEQQVAARTAQVRALASSLAMAEQAERRQLSQILHDDLQQRLYGMQMRMMTILNDLQAGNTTKLAHYAQQVYNWMGDAIQTTRQLTVDLSPPVLKHEGLADALQWLVRQMAEMNGLQVQLQTVETVSIRDENMRVLLFQIVRELLFNVVKHGKTDHAYIELSKGGEEECVIIVRDEGCGFDVTAAPMSSGFGLFSVRERLQLFGGRITIQSAPNQGTRITIHAPIGATTHARKGKDSL